MVADCRVGTPCVSWPGCLVADWQLRIEMVEPTRLAQHPASDRSKPATPPAPPLPPPLGLASALTLSLASSLPPALGSALSCLELRRRLRDAALHLPLDRRPLLLPPAPPALPLRNRVCRVPHHRWALPPRRRASLGSARPRLAQSQEASLLPANRGQSPSALAHLSRCSNVLAFAHSQSLPIPTLLLRRSTRRRASSASPPSAARLSRATASFSSSCPRSSAGPRNTSSWLSSPRSTSRVC